MNEALLYQDIQLVALLSGARTFMEGFQQYPDADPMARVMANEWLTALDQFCQRTGVKLYE